MKRNIRALLILMCAMLVFQLAACGDKSKTSSGETGTTSESSAAATAAAATAQETTEKKQYDKQITINWATIQAEASRDYNGDEFTKWWLDRFNIKWDIVPLTWENWAENLRIWINSGDMPELATWNYNHGELVNYVDQGQIFKLPGDWKTKWPNVAKVYADTGIGEKLDELFGGTYALPKPIFSKNKPIERLVPHTTLYMRKDWMQAVGAEIKDVYTTSEVMAIAEKIKAADPGKLGSKLTPITIYPNNMLHMFVTANSTYAKGEYYVGNDGKYHWGPADEATLYGLKKYQEAYKKGLLHPEFFTLKQKDGQDAFYAAGTSAMLMEGGLAIYSTSYASELKKNLNLEADNVLHQAIVIGDDGKYHAMENTNFWTANLFAPDIKEETFTRIMDIFDYSASEEGQNFIRMGFEGVDWKKEADGSFTSLLEEGMTAEIKYPSQMPIYVSMLVLADDFGLVNPTLPKKYRDFTKKMYELKAQNSDETSVPPLNWDLYFYDSPAKRKVALDYAKEYAQLVLMNGDLETNWKAWIQDKMQMVQPVLDELNTNLLK